MRNRDSAFHRWVAALGFGAAALMLLFALGCGVFQRGKDPLADMQEGYVLPDEDAVFERAYRTLLNGKLDEARHEFGLLRERPDKGGRRAADALFWKAYCLERMGEASEAASLYQQLREEHPTARYAALAEARLDTMRPY